MERLRKTSQFTPEYILQRYASWLWRDEVDDAKCQQLLNVLQQRQQQCQVSSNSRDLVAHMYVDTRMRRELDA